jgi:hypothetical protein
MTQAPRISPPPWAEVPCRGSSTSVWPMPPSATRRWWPSHRACGGGPRWCISISEATHSRDEGLVALVAPPPPAGALPLPTGGLKKLETLILDGTQVSDAGCAALAAALDNGALPALQYLSLDDIPASAAAKEAVRAALARSRVAFRLSLLTFS